MTAIEFLKRYRPDELVRCGTGEFQLRSHDSFKISESTSLWHWKSRDIGGKSALDYLIHVEGVPFLEAVRYMLEQEAPSYMPQTKATEQKQFVLPAGARGTHHVELYLQSRGISIDVIRYCISKGILYESTPHHNCVFVGLNNEGMPRYATLRSTTVPFPVSWTVKMKKKQKETQDILSYHTQAAGCSDKARAKASGGRQPIEECGRTGL